MIARWRAARFARSHEFGAYLKVDTGPSHTGCAFGFVLGALFLIGLLSSGHRSWLLAGVAPWAGGVLFDLLAQPWRRRTWAFEGGLVQRVRGRLSAHPWDTVSLDDWHSPDPDERDPHKWGLELPSGSTILISRTDAERLLAHVPDLRRRPAAD